MIFEDSYVLELFDQFWHFFQIYIENTLCFRHKRKSKIFVISCYLKSQKMYVTPRSRFLSRVIYIFDIYAEIF